MKQIPAQRSSGLAMGESSGPLGTVEQPLVSRSRPRAGVLWWEVSTRPDAVFTLVHCLHLPPGPMCMFYRQHGRSHKLAFHSAQFPRGSVVEKPVTRKLVGECVRGPSASTRWNFCPWNECILGDFLLLGSVGIQKMKHCYSLLLLLLLLFC